MVLANHTAIVTGGGSGIGKECVRLFAESGANVVIADWNEAEANRVAEEINNQHASLNRSPRAIAVRTDVSKVKDVELLVAKTLETYGGIDVLLNNAAVILPKHLEEIDEAEFDKVVAVNLKGVFLVTKHAIPFIKRNQGTIVNMASLNGLVGQRQNPVYAATKGGVIAMTKSLALDYAADGVRVNCVCPAGVMTPLLQEWTQMQDDPAMTVQALNDMHPLGRPAKPEEVAQVVLYLASSQSAFITGTALPVDGGASLGY
ncbi:NAD(P)-dependent dehydrogenase, short-chain alcohol dehydrogenase family [Paenibacillus sp. yr247]|uniref:SDR family NAD(P)-dependent oxidoreductase n=1 Tax=Paenibacillus sp. yr247 TaxID=1761880 RepID=UPI00088A271E|nr:SDR family oxidoreductase [Paenibacillus sp. yr247]SDO35518.1 NAD(P)-dependent dehydrogenase, short-chain alcohol dehydrogenase family [Paenibacillus sp. yr247]